MYSNIKSAGTSNNKNENEMKTSDTKVVDLKVERESDDEGLQIEIELYDDHVMKVEYNSNCSQEIHSESSGETSEPNQHHNSNDSNGLKIKLEIEAMPTVKEEPPEELYDEHEIKYEMFIEPAVLPTVTYMKEENGEPLPKKLRLDTRNENTESDNTAKKTRIETNTEEMTPKDCNENTEPSDTEPMELKPDLAQHIESHDKTKQDIYFKCKECTYRSVTQCSLERHLKLHDKSRRFVCDACGYRYANNKHLKQHKRSVHSDQKIHECANCDYKTNIIRNLNTHLRIHSGEKPYSCSLCDYKCNHKSHLKTHALIHTGEKPYSCSQCEYKCSQKNDLKIHSLIHTGEKPYSCSECNYKCSRSSNLKRHLRTHIKTNYIYINVPE